MCLCHIHPQVLESRRIFNRLQGYVVYRLATTVQYVLVLFAMVVGFDFRLSPFLVVLLALLADVTALPISVDRSQPARTPLCLPCLGLGVRRAPLVNTPFSHHAPACNAP